MTKMTETAPERLFFALRNGELSYWADQRDGVYRIDVEYVRADLVPQWRPIETAPRDGREVLGSFGGRPFEMYLGPFGDWLDMKDRVRDPRYWMPLPPPPEVNK